MDEISEKNIAEPFKENERNFNILAKIKNVKEEKEKNSMARIKNVKQEHEKISVADQDNTFSSEDYELFGKYLAESNFITKQIIVTMFRKWLEENEYLVGMVNSEFRNDFNPFLQKWNSLNSVQLKPAVKDGESLTEYAQNVLKVVEFRIELETKLKSENIN